MDPGSASASSKNKINTFNFHFLNPVPVDASQSILENIKFLCKQYFQKTLVNDFNFDPSYQDLDTELSDLPGRYSADSNGTLIYCSTTKTSTPVGLVGIKCISHRFLEKDSVSIHLKNTHPIWRQIYSKYSDFTIGELKRMYIDTKFRGLGLSKKLLSMAIENAKLLQFDVLVLDTLAGMTFARKLYKKYGFKECHAYVYNPSKEVVYYSLCLSQRSIDLQDLIIINPTQQQ